MFNQYLSRLFISICSKPPYHLTFFFIFQWWRKNLTASYVMNLLLATK